MKRFRVGALRWCVGTSIRFYREVKMPKGGRLGAKDDDQGAHLDDLEPTASLAFSKGLRADLDVSLNPTAPPTAIEAQLKFHSISAMYQPAVYAYKTIDAVDMVALMKKNGLVPARDAEEVVTQTLSVTPRLATELTLTERVGEERWRILSAALRRRLDRLDEKGVTPIVRRLRELGLDEAVWKPFLRGAMVACIQNRYLRRQLADALIGIRNGEVPQGNLLSGGPDETKANAFRTLQLTSILFAAAREIGENAFAMYCIDLVHESGGTVSYAVQKEIMYVNFAERRRRMDNELRTSGELRTMVPYFLREYLPRAELDKVYAAANDGRQKPEHASPVDEEEVDTDNPIDGPTRGPGSQFFVDEATTETTYKSTGIHKVMSSMVDFSDDTPVEETEAPPSPAAEAPPSTAAEETQDLIPASRASYRAKPKLGLKTKGRPRKDDDDGAETKAVRAVHPVDLTLLTPSGKLSKRALGSPVPERAEFKARKKTKASQRKLLPTPPPTPQRKESKKKSMKI